MPAVARRCEALYRASVLVPPSPVACRGAGARRQELRIAAFGPAPCFATLPTGGGAALVRARRLALSRACPAADRRFCVGLDWSSLRLRSDPPLPTQVAAAQPRAPANSGWRLALLRSRALRRQPLSLSLAASGHQNMPGSISAFLFPSVPAVFVSDYPLAGSVERLSGIVLVPFAGRFTRSTAQGVVTEQRVRLARLIPFVGNSYRPQFFGSFQKTEQGVVLSGHFTMARWVKVYAGFGIGFTVFWTALVVLGTLLGRATVWWGPLAGLGFVVFAVASLKWSQWLSRGDVPWLSQVIGRALTTPDKWPAEPPSQPSRLRRWFLDFAGQ